MIIGTTGSTIILMTKRLKRVKKLFTNPKVVTFKELDTVLLGFGFTCRQPKSGSSHFAYFRDGTIITLPYKRPYVREVYVKQVLEIIGEEI